MSDVELHIVWNHEHKYRSLRGRFVKMTKTHHHEHIEYLLLKLLQA